MSSKESAEARAWFGYSVYSTNWKCFDWVGKSCMIDFEISIDVFAYIIW